MYFCTMIHRLMLVYFKFDWKILRAYAILQSMQMLCCWNQCKIIREGAQNFWKRGPKYKIIKKYNSMHTYIHTYIHIYIYIFSRLGGSDPHLVPSLEWSQTRNSCVPSKHINQGDSYTFFHSKKITLLPTRILLPMLQT